MKDKRDRVIGSDLCLYRTEINRIKIHPTTRNVGLYIRHEGHCVQKMFFFGLHTTDQSQLQQKNRKKNLAVHRSHQSQSTQRMLLASPSEVKGVYKYVFLLFVFFFSQKTKNKKTFQIKYKKTKKCWQSNKIKPVTQEVKCKFIEKCLKKVVTYVIFDKDIKKVFLHFRTIST